MAGATTEEAGSGPVAADTVEAPGEASSARGWRGHPRIVTTLIVVASVIAVLAASTTWAKRQLLDTDNWVSVTDELLADPTIREALAQYAVDQLYANVDIGAQLEDRLPEDLQGLAGPAAAALRGPAVETVDRLLGSSAIQSVWSTANREAHELLVGVLEDDRPIVDTAGGVVSLQLGDLIRQLGERLGVPDSVLDRIPPEAGTIVLVESDQLAAAQRATSVVQLASVWLFVLVIALYALAVAIAADRRRALRNVGWALLAASIVLLAVRRVALAYVTSFVEDPSNQAPAREVFLIASGLLAQLAWTGILYAVVIVLGALYAGPTRPAAAVRRWVAPAMSASPVAVWSVAVAAFVLLALWGPTPAFDAWWSTLLLAAGFLGGVEALRRQSRREHPDAEWGPLLESARRQAGRAGSWVGGLGRRRRTSGQVAELERLAHLHGTGAIDDEEYTTAKRTVLSGAPSPTPGPVSPAGSSAGVPS